MPVVACLHTAASNVAVFEAACPADLTLRHSVRSDLLVEAEREGGVTETLEQWMAAALLALTREADAVVLTCSTFGPAIARAQPCPVPIIGSDAALAAEAMRGAAPLVVLCSSPTTLAPTRALYSEAGVRAAVQMVPGAWTMFRSGDLPAYHRRVADAADHAFAAGAGTVALAQSSMAAAAWLCKAGVPLTSPCTALRAALRACA
jgi:hypothetical protein